MAGAVAREPGSLLLEDHAMTVEQLRTALHAQPFRPFALRMADGRSLTVAHPDFLSISPSGRTVIVYREDDSFSIVDLLLVNELDVQASGSKPQDPEANGSSAS